jgi:hypothetical protein
METIQQAAAAFLANKRIAVTGVSRTPKTHGSNNVYRRLRERGYQVFAVNPNTGQVEGDRCPGAGSVSDAATSYGRRHGITVIDGGCPLMFGPTADFGHKIMRLVYAGHVPKQV